MNSIDPKIWIAGGVVGVALTLFLAAYVANGVGQIRHTGMYTPPPDLIQFFQLIFGASITILSFGSIKAAKDNKIEDKNGEDKTNNCPK